MKQPYHSLVIYLFLLTYTFLISACGGGDGNNNQPPVANAGPDQTTNVIIGDLVLLDGSASSDQEGAPLSYSWSIVSAPGGSSAALSDASSVNPSFTVDVVGTYALQLVVNDGTNDSAADEMLTVAVIPAPTVTISSPLPETIATSNPVLISGTVDDPDAEITVNGIATANNSGSYAAELSLSEGSNTVSVVATNSTGEGSASVNVTLQTGPGPKMNITSHAKGFLAGRVWDGTGTAPKDTIGITVKGSIIARSGTPVVTVNGVAATISSGKFSAIINLSKGMQTITAVGSDGDPGISTITVDGTADYCHKLSEDPGVSAELRANQSNRCHEIDGCSVYLYEGGLLAKLDLRNNPMPLAQFNQAPTAFGAGVAPPAEFFVHGHGPAQPLPCNYHDVCYQTTGTSQTNCDSQMYERMKNVCRKAYPSTCPYTGLQVVKCPAYFAERGKCFSAALTYYTGLATFGGPTFKERQAQYSTDK